MKLMGNNIQQSGKAIKQDLCAGLFHTSKAIQCLILEIATVLGYF